MTNPIDEMLEIAAEINHNERCSWYDGLVKPPPCNCGADRLYEAADRVRAWRAREMSVEDLARIYWSHADRHMENWCSHAGLRAVERAARERTP